MMNSDKDDAFIRIYDSNDYEGGDHGHGHSHGDTACHGHGGGDKKDKAAEAASAAEEDMKHYKASMSKLKCVSFVSIFFIAAQLVGGYLANSIAIFTDTAHLSSDMIGFAISMGALKIAMRESSKEFTFGWHRAEILGTLLSIIFLLTLTIVLVFNAVDRVIAPQEVKGFEMAVTAVMGLGFNLIQMKILHSGEGHYHLGGDDHGHAHGDEEADGDDHGHSHSHGGSTSGNFALDAAFLHALGDMIMSIGVCIAATIIYFYPTATVADPICTFVFSAIVCVTVIPVFKKCVLVLMEGTPQGFDVEKLIKDMQTAGEEFDNELVIYDFRLWQISQGKLALSAHIRTSSPMEVLDKVTTICKTKYAIDHCTLQVEDITFESKHKFELDSITNKNKYLVDLSPGLKKKQRELEKRESNINDY